MCPRFLSDPFASGLIVFRGRRSVCVFREQADTSNIVVPDRYLLESTPAMPDGPPPRDWALCRWLALEGGVIAIPASPFFSSENKALGANYVRFAFCKSDDTLRLAGDRMAALFASEQPGHAK